jgi:hypothetical protein
MSDTCDKVRGCLLGLACGDAVGTSIEFRSRGSFPPLTDMVGGGPFGLQPELATLARIDQSIGEAVDLLRSLLQAVPQHGLRNVSDYGMGDWVGIMFRAAIALVVLQILLVIVGMMIFAFFS